MRLVGCVTSCELVWLVCWDGGRVIIDCTVGWGEEEAGNGSDRVHLISWCGGDEQGPHSLFLSLLLAYSSSSSSSPNPNQQSHVYEFLSLSTLLNPR